MKYVQPYGAEEGTSYVNADAAAGIEGSPVPAAAIEHPMRELMAAIEEAGLEPSSGDLTQLAQAIQALAYRQPIAHYTLDGATDIAGVFVASSGVFTPPAGARYVEITLVGGGGGGNRSADRTVTCGGAAGGAIKLRVPFAAGDTYAVAIGAGGAGVAGTVGGDGGDTQVTGPGGAWVATAGGGTGGAETNESRAGGECTCVGISPVEMYDGMASRATMEVDTNGATYWFNLGASSLFGGNLLSSPYAPGQGGIAFGTANYPGFDGGDGVVYVTVY